MKCGILLVLSLVVLLSGCSTIESLTCEIGGWDPNEIDDCNPQWDIDKLDEKHTIPLSE